MVCEEASLHDVVIPLYTWQFLNNGQGNWLLSDSSFASIRTNVCKEMEEWVSQCAGYGCKKGLKPESPNQEIDSIAIGTWNLMTA